jgi:hypothetical protein
MGAVISPPPVPMSREMWNRMSPEEKEHHRKMEIARAMAPRCRSGSDGWNPLGWLIAGSIFF